MSAQNSKQYIFSRDDIRLFLRPVASHQRRLRRLDFKVSAVGLVGAALVYALALIPSLIVYNRTAPAAVPGLPQVAAAVPPENLIETAPLPADPTIQRDELVLERLGIIAPIRFDIPYIEKEIQRELKEGVVHLAGSAKPGQQGTAIITGHSSSLAWVSGNYKTVFAPLLKSALEDEITIHLNGELFTYRVSEVYEVAPSRVDLLQSSEDVDLRLITCSPLGSTRRRFIVDAVQITPDRAANAPFTGQPINADQIVAAR